METNFKCHQSTRSVSSRTSSISRIDRVASTMLESTYSTFAFKSFSNSLISTRCSQMNFSSRCADEVGFVPEEQDIELEEGAVKEKAYAEFHCFYSSCHCDQLDDRLESIARSVANCSCHISNVSSHRAYLRFLCLLILSASALSLLACPCCQTLDLTSKQY